MPSAKCTRSFGVNCKLPLLAKRAASIRMVTSSLYSRSTTSVSASSPSTSSSARVRWNPSITRKLVASTTIGELNALPSCRICLSFARFVESSLLASWRGHSFQSSTSSRTLTIFFLSAIRLPLSFRSHTGPAIEPPALIGAPGCRFIYLLLPPLGKGSLLSCGCLDSAGSLVLVGCLPEAGSLMTAGGLMSHGSLVDSGDLFRGGSLRPHGYLFHAGSLFVLGCLRIDGSLGCRGRLPRLGSLYRLRRPL